VYEFIALCESGFSVLALCAAMSVSRSAYYEWRQGKSHRLKEEKSDVGRQVKMIFETNLERYGSRRIEAELKEKGIAAGRCQIRNRMREQGLKAVQPRSFVPKTTQTNPNLRRSENLLLQIGVVARINQVWAGDITYVPMADGSWSYLATWMDLCSRLIVGWELSRSLDAVLVIRSFQKGLWRRNPPPGLIAHSDGGGQYMDIEFRALLALNKCRQSMTRVDNHYDNAFAESLFSRFKAELLRGGAFLDFEDAHTAIFEYIEVYYNRTRRNSALNYKSPENFEIALINHNP
jgi:transposase InsO family protein